MGVIKYNLEDDALLAYNNGNGYSGHYLYNLGKAIIDYNNAIRNGYVQIKEAINEMIEEGVNNEE